MLVASKLQVSYDSSPASDQENDPMEIGSSGGNSLKSRRRSSSGSLSGRKSSKRSNLCNENMFAILGSETCSSINEEDIVFAGAISRREKEVIAERGLSDRRKTNITSSTIEKIAKIEKTSTTTTRKTTTSTTTSSTTTTTTSSTTTLSTTITPQNALSLWEKCFRVNFLCLKEAIVKLQKRWKRKNSLRKRKAANLIIRACKTFLQVRKMKLKELEEKRQILQEIRRKKEALLKTTASNNNQKESVVVEPGSSESFISIPGSKKASKRKNHQLSSKSTCNPDSSSSKAKATTTENNMEKITAKNTNINTGYKTCTLDYKLVKKRSPKPPSPSSKVRKMNSNNNSQKKSLPESSQLDSAISLSSCPLSLESSCEEMAKDENDGGKRRVRFPPNPISMLVSYPSSISITSSCGSSKRNRGTTLINEKDIESGSDSRSKENVTPMATLLKSCLKKNIGSSVNPELERENNNATAANATSTVNVIIQRFMYQQPSGGRRKK